MDAFNIFQLLIVVTIVAMGIREYRYDRNREKEIIEKGRRLRDGR